MFSTAWLGSTQALFAEADCRKLWQHRQRNWRGPNLWDVDTGLLKNFAPVPHHENVNFQFRGEFFNLFNHPQWADPNVTFSNAAFGTTRGTIGTNADSSHYSTRAEDELLRREQGSWNNGFLNISVIQICKEPGENRQCRFSPGFL